MLTITSSAFANNGSIPPKYIAEGDDVSPRRSSGRVHRWGQLTPMLGRVGARGASAALRWRESVARVCGARGPFRGISYRMRMSAYMEG